MKICGDLEFQLQTQSIVEITNNDDWSDNSVISMKDSDIKEIIAGDEKPFYIEFIALYEGVSGNNRVYEAGAVKSCATAMIGVNMYKGHQEPGTEAWKYREPAGKIIASKLEKIKLADGSVVLAAKGKAYITETENKLRSDIRKKMAGSVSINGYARIVQKPNSDLKTVVELRNPLSSIDFCNPGTGGMSHAGVTGIVSEMVGVEKNLKNEDQMKLTKEQLIAEYASEITEIIGDRISKQVKEIADSKHQLANDRESFKAEKAELEAKVAEITKSRDAVLSELEKMKADFEKEKSSRIVIELEKFAASHVAEMIEEDSDSKNLIEIAAKRTKAILVDNDLEKSKSAFVANLKSAIDDLSELSEIFGGSVNKNSDDDDEGKPPTKNHKKNHKKGSDLFSRFISPELQKSGKS